MRVDHASFDLCVFFCEIIKLFKFYNIVSRTIQVESVLNVCCPVSENEMFLMQGKVGQFSITAAILGYDKDYLKGIDFTVTITILLLWFTCPLHPAVVTYLPSQGRIIVWCLKHDINVSEHLYTRQVIPKLYLSRLPSPSFDTRKMVYYAECCVFTV